MSTTRSSMKAPRVASMCPRSARLASRDTRSIRQKSYGFARGFVAGGATDAGDTGASRDASEPVVLAAGGGACPASALVVFELDFGVHAARTTVITSAARRAAPIDRA